MARLSDLPEWERQHHLDKIRDTLRDRAELAGLRDATGGWFILWVKLGLIGTSVALRPRQPG